MSLADGGQLIAGVGAVVLTYLAILIETRRRRHGFCWSLWDGAMWLATLLLWYAALWQPFSK